MRETSTRTRTRALLPIAAIAVVGWAVLGCAAPQPSAEVEQAVEQPAAEPVEHPNETLTRRYLAAGQAGDIETLRSILAEDAVMHFFGRNPLSGVHTGREEAWARIGEEWGPRQMQFEILEIQDLLVNDERAVVLLSARISSPERTVDLNRIDVYRIVDGQIVELWVYDDKQYDVDEFFS